MAEPEQTVVPQNEIASPPPQEAAAPTNEGQEARDAEARRARMAAETANKPEEAVPAPAQPAESTEQKPSRSGAGIVGRFFNFIGLRSEEKQPSAPGLQPVGISPPEAAPSAPPKAFVARPQVPLTEVKVAPAMEGDFSINENQVSVVGVEAKTRWDNALVTGRALDAEYQQLASAEQTIRKQHGQRVSAVFAGGYRDGGAAVDAYANQVRDAVINRVNPEDYIAKPGMSQDERMAQNDAYIAAREGQIRELQSLASSSVMPVREGQKPIKQQAADELAKVDTSVDNYLKLTTRIRVLEGDQNQLINEAEASGQKGLSEAQNKQNVAISRELMELQNQKALIEVNPEFQRNVSARLAANQASQAASDNKLAELDFIERAGAATPETAEKKNSIRLTQQENGYVTNDLLEAQKSANSEVTRIRVETLTQQKENEIASRRMKAVDEEFVKASTAAFAAPTRYMDQLVQARSESPTGVGGWNAGVANAMIGQAEVTTQNRLAPVQQAQERNSEARAANYASGLNIDTMVDAQNSGGPNLKGYLMKPDAEGKVTQLNMPEDARLEITPTGMNAEGKKTYGLRVVGSSDAAFQTMTMNVDSSQLKTLINAGDSGTLRIVFKGDANKAPELNVTSTGARVEYSKVRITAVGTDPSLFEEAGVAKNRRIDESLAKRKEQAETNLARAQQIGEIKDLEKMAKQAAKGTLAQNVSEGGLGGLKAPVPGRASSNYVG